MHKLKLEELGRASVEEFKAATKIPVVVVLDNIRSMQNVGSVFRTSDAFAVEKILLCGITARPPHRDIQRAALGATESVDWVHEEKILPALETYKAKGYRIIGLEQTSESVLLNSGDFRTDSNEKYVLVLGNEVEGISDEILPMLDLALEIPQSGTKHSLNVSVAAGVALWWFYEQLA